MNVATIFPLWPGNIGLLQAAVALPLRRYGVAYGTGFAYGLVLQAIEMSVGVGVGLVMLAREGLSFASLRTIEEEEEDSAETVLAAETSQVSRTASEDGGAWAGEPGEPRDGDLLGRGESGLVAGDGGQELVTLERMEHEVVDGGDRRRPRDVS
jgi:hypothetical protein